MESALKENGTELSMSNTGVGLEPYLLSLQY